MNEGKWLLFLFVEASFIILELSSLRYECPILIKIFGKVGNKKIFLC